MAERDRDSAISNTHAASEQGSGARHEAPRARPNGPADVAAGWRGGYWQAPRDYGGQADAAGQRGARDEAGTARPGSMGTPHSAPFRDDVGVPPRSLLDGDQLVGGHGYSGLARQARFERRGPKGYRRSDARIREDLCEALMAATHLDASEVTVEVADAIVRLDGTVPERRMKHAIEDIAAGCPGVTDVDNRIHVVRSD